MKLKLARPTAALSDVLKMNDQIHPRRNLPNRFEIKRGHRWDGATVSNRNIFNAKVNGNVKERKVMRGVWTTSNVPNERRERESRPDGLCAESTAIRKR